MTKTQYYTATSLDGYIADESHSLDWLFEVERGENPGAEYEELFAGVGAMAMGASTYEWILGHEDLVGSPEKWQSWYGATPTWVFTHRELPAIPGAAISFVQGDVASVHVEMKAKAGGKNIWLVGGGDLAGQFADQGLLDEIIVGVAPVTLGGGAPLLPRRLTASQLELVDAKQSGQFVYLTYRLRAT
jgi:dihydrofolate reductase